MKGYAERMADKATKFEDMYNSLLEDYHNRSTQIDNLKEEIKRLKNLKLYNIK